MRSLLLISAAALLAGCSTPAEQARYEANAQSSADARLQTHLAGKVAGQSQDCLPHFRTQDMVRVDDDTVLFRDGANRIFRNELVGSCNGLRSSSSTLVTKSFGAGGRMCQGDIAQVIDSSSGTLIGSCSLGAFVPYTRAGG